MKKNFRENHRKVKTQLKINARTKSGATDLEEKLCMWHYAPHAYRPSRNLAWEPHI